MRCFLAKEYDIFEGEFGNIIATRRGRVNFCYSYLRESRWAVTIGCVRDVLLAFTDLRPVYPVYEVNLLLGNSPESWWRVGLLEGFVADFPYPPLPSEGRWSRLLADVMFKKPAEVDFNINLVTGEVLEGPRKYVSGVPPAYFVREAGLKAVFYILSLRKSGVSTGNVYDDAYKAVVLPHIGGFGGSKLIGEVFRIVERDGDYLRLVGRGGDVYLAWDFVLGTLDSGEWVLFGEDGLYLAERRGEEVVVKGPYDGSIFDVRGPPYAPYYPVVEEVSWVKKALEKAREIARRLGAEDVYVARAPVDPQILLKWSLTNVKWEFRVVPELAPPHGGEVYEKDCRWFCERGFVEFCEARE